MTTTYTTGGQVIGANELPSLQLFADRLVARAKQEFPSQAHIVLRVAREELVEVKREVFEMQPTEHRHD